MNGELSKQVTLLIPTCSAFSDLWKAMVYFIQKNWIEAPVIIVSDRGELETGDSSIRFFADGSEPMDFASRLRHGLERVETQFVCLILDDYFFTKPINESSIGLNLDAMIGHGLDYLRYDYTSGTNRYPKLVHGYSSIQTGPYSVNLTPGLWKTESLCEVAKDLPTSPWECEVALDGLFFQKGFHGAYAKKNSLPYLDGVRKGKLLPKAHHYLNKRGLYDGNRPIMPRFAAMKNAAAHWLSRYLPPKIRVWYKKRAIKRGETFYSGSD